MIYLRKAGNRLSGTSRAGNEPYHPFLSHAYLSALEDSGSATTETGWLGRHLLLEDAAGELIGAVPCYLKSHSQGEYVFDHSWADAFERAGGRYYPKLLSAVPFTPATGPRFLVRPRRVEKAETFDRGHEAVRDALLQGAVTLVERLGVSSLHVNFPTEPEWQTMGEAGLLLRQDMQFVWRNDGYRTFDGFLAALSSNRRRTIRRQRRDARPGSTSAC